MKKLFLFLFITSIISFGATISGNQGQVSISGGSMSVTSNGSSVTVNSGQTTTFGEGQGPSAPKATTKNDIDKIKKEMDVKSDKDIMNIKYPAKLSSRFINGLQQELISKGIEEELFSYRVIGGVQQLRITALEVDKIKKIYPPYYKLVVNYYKKKKRKNSKVPTITIKYEHLKKFHKALFIKYGG